MDYFMVGRSYLFMNVRRVDRKRVVNYMDFYRFDEKDYMRKRFRSLVDVSEFFIRDGFDFRFLFFRGNLLVIFEIKVENIKRNEDCV